jgi:hypothetical protein
MLAAGRVALGRCLADTNVAGVSRLIGFRLARGDVQGVPPPRVFLTRASDGNIPVPLPSRRMAALGTNYAKNSVADAGDSHSP